MGYLLDSNIFIQAKNEYYGFDLCPGFWDWLEQQNQYGKVFSIDRVQGELINFSDELSKWAANQGSNFFLPIDHHTITEMTNVSNWVMNGPHRTYAKNSFLGGADPFLIAYAKAHNHTVVSHEIYVPNELRKLKIPVVCQGLNVSCIRTFEMLRNEKASFILS